MYCSTKKTDSSFTDNKKTVYVCEVVSWKDYEKAQTVEMIAKTPTVEMLAEELIRANNDNRELRRKIDELIRSRATESEGGK